MTEETPKKRGGLRLPPKGQALARLQDLEAGGIAMPPASQAQESIDAVLTASSKSSSNDVSDAAQPGPALVAPSPRTRLRVAQPVQREATVRITVDLPESLHRDISILSATSRKSIKDLVIDAVRAAYFTPEGE